MALPCITGQGDSVFHDAQHGEEAVSLPSAGSESDGDVGVAVEPRPGNGRVAQGGQILRCVSRADATSIFVESHVADVMRAVFDAPVLTPPGPKLRRVGLLPQDAGDRVFDLIVHLAVASSGAHQPADLLQSWPIQLAR